MQSSEPQRGIERRILTSILSVSVLPLVVALLVGFYIIREAQSNAVKQTLLTAAQTTSSGLRIVSNSQVNSIRALASNPQIVAALTPDSHGLPTVLDSPVVLNDITELLANQAGTGSPERAASIFMLFDSNYKFITGTSSNPAMRISHPDWPALKSEQPKFFFEDYTPETNRYMGQYVATVESLEAKQVIGYVSEVFDMTTLVKFALGFDPNRGLGPSKTDLHRLVFDRGNGQLVAARLDERSDANNPVLKTEILEPDFARSLRLNSDNKTDIFRDQNFRVDGKSVDSFVAYDRLSIDYDPVVYIVVSRSASDVYRRIDLWAGVALVSCFIFIGFLALNAYRNVHNNIVRPVLLLNEGAQIIGQGDLELKLKIGTGDEIEELAMSFNKMALALKGNIRQLEDSEERYRGLVTSMRDGIIQADLDGAIAFINPTGLDIFGFAQVESAIGINVQTLFIDQVDFASFNAHLKSRGFVERTRVWMRRQDGRSICVEISGNLVHDDEGKEIGVEGIFRDITKNIRLEREAQDRAERLSAINQIANVINSSLEAGRLYESLVVEVKKLVDFDYAELALLNDKSEAFTARRLWPEHDDTPPREYRMDDEHSCSAWVAHRQECLVVDDLFSPDCVFTGQFTTSTQSCLCVPLYATGRIIGTLNLGANRVNGFSHHDVEVLEQMAPHVAVAIRNAQLLENLQLSLEEVTRAREKLYEANEEMKTLDEMKTNLLSNVSHELRTPLVSVMGYTDMILNGKAGPTTDVQREFLGISLRNIEKLVTLIENLLDFSRLHRGKEKLVFDEFDLVECAKSSIQIIQPVADGREIVLSLQAPEEPIVVDGEKGKMGQVFNNLLSNAVKFNHPGGHVTITMKLMESSVEVVVTDSGIGIPQEALDKIFTRFYQYDSSSTRKYGGTGIGLSIAQDIVRLHGSRITVTSEIGKGTTFRFTLALARQKVESNADDEAIPSETRLLVEVVTLDRALATQVRNMLMSEGMDVLHAGTPRYAIALAQKHSPDCILVDVESPVNGKTMMDRLLGENVELDRPIILLTNDDEVYARYRTVVSCRLKREFRKSILLSGIHHAMTQNGSLPHRLGSRILCVDDDPEVLNFISRCLEAEGYDVECVRSGEEAIAKLANREFGLVLLDLAMPGLDGWETLRRIRSNPDLEGIRVFLVSAKQMDHLTALRPRERGADGFLLKPFHSGDLLELVQGLPILHAAKEV